MVTHNLNEIRQSCTRALWLEQGVLIADEDDETVLAQYEGRVVMIRSKIGRYRLGGAA
jgi:ABC-type polysaccharide/polyol phosphate transport system ATPase subunit